jgi:hypothetical protein
MSTLCIADAVVVDETDLLVAGAPRMSPERRWAHLEINTAMNRGLEAMGARLVKRWRVYERLLEPGAKPSTLNV